MKELVEAEERYLQGQPGALEVILNKLNASVYVDQDTGGAGGDSQPAAILLNSGLRL